VVAEVQTTEATQRVARGVAAAAKAVVPAATATVARVDRTRRRRRRHHHHLAALLSAIVRELDVAGQFRWTVTQSGRVGVLRLLPGGVSRRPRRGWLSGGRYGGGGYGGKGGYPDHPYDRAGYS
jgi:hypothetical protein